MLFSLYVDRNWCTRAEVLVLWAQDRRFYNETQHDWNALVRWWYQIPSCWPEKRYRVLPKDERKKLKDTLRRIMGMPTLPPGSR